MKKCVFILLCGMFLNASVLAQSPDYEAKKQKALTETSPFEKIAQRITKEVVLEYEDNDFIVFEPNSKQASVHLLIVPKKRINTLNEITPDEQLLMGKMILLAKEMAKKKGIDQTGYRIALNTNEDAGQSVFHIHLHLLGGNKIGAMVDPTYRNTQKEIANQQKAEKLRAMLNSLLTTAQLPALSIAISRNGEIVFAEGFGYADIVQKKPVTTTTQFRTASVAKVITATALAKMTQDKIIDLNAPISQYVKDLPAPYQPLTAKQLAGHLAGVPHYNIFTDKIENRFYATTKEALNVFLHQHLLAAPNTSYNYSTHGFTLLS
ncbi:MAG: serine hydrolase, partial [Thermoflexibacteraceae bacterium]